MDTTVRPAGIISVTSALKAGGGTRVFYLQPIGDGVRSVDRERRGAEGAPLTEASLVKVNDGSTTLVLVDTGEVFWSNDSGLGIVFFFERTLAGLVVEERR